AWARNAVGIRIIVRQSRRRRWIRVISEFARSFLENGHGVRRLVRADRILFRSRTFKDVPALDELALNVAGLSADAEHLLRAHVVRLDIRPAEWPVLNRKIRGKT